MRYAYAVKIERRKENEKGSKKVSFTFHNKTYGMHTP